MSMPAASRRPVVIIGNLTIDDVVQPDGTTQMATLGGNCVHASAAALAWAADVGVVARCGTDFPAQAIARLREAGVDVAGIRDIDGPTVRNWVIYEADGRRHWVYRTPRGRSAEVAPQPGDIPAGWLTRDPAPVVHIAAMPLAAAAAIAASVRERAPAATITLDTHEDWRSGAEVVEVARLADVFLPSREELAGFLGYDDPRRAAAELIGSGVRCVAVKMGGDGVLVSRPGRPQEHVPASPASVVDPTGAGDNFCGGFAAGLALGDDIAAAAERGCVTAAAAIGAAGSLRMLGRGGLARELLSARRAAAADPESKAATPRRDGPEPAADDGSRNDDYGIDVMRREIATIPEVIAGHLGDPSGHVRELADWLAGRGIEHLYLTGCGDSAFAGLAAALAFRRHSRLRVHPVHALELARYRVRYLPPASAVLAVSYGGTVGRTIEAARQATDFGHPVIALTGNADGQLAAAADRVMPIDVPTLGFSPGTSTYIGMLCTLIELALRTAPADAPRTAAEEIRRACAQLPGQAAKTLDWCDGPAAETAARIGSGRFVAFLGGGPNEATARFGAAKLFEGAQQLAVATNTEEWAHEEYFITRPGDPVIVVAPSGASQDRAWEILSELLFIKADATVVSDIEPPRAADGHLRLAAGTPEELSPVLAALPLAQLGFHLAGQAGKRSYNFPDQETKDEHYDTIHRATRGDPA